MGIFGFLAKSHINSTIDLGANQADLVALNQQEKLANDKLNYLLARAKDPSTASNKLDNQIQDVQRELRKIAKDRLPLIKESNSLSVEVGPIKYVAELVYGTSSDSIDKAVRLVIILIMSVFDPLAVLLLIAANISLKQKEEEKLSQQSEVEYEKVVDLIPTDQVQMAHEEVEEIHNDELPKLSPDEEVILEKLKESGELDIDKSIEMRDTESVANTVVQEPEDGVVKQTTHLAPGVYMEEHVSVDKKKRKK
jgi:hypothetical protein